MKKLTILFTITLIISCKEGSKQNSQQTSLKQDTVAVDTVAVDTVAINQAPSESSCQNWVANFREFRNAVYTNDKIKAIKFVDLTTLDDQAWSLVHLGDDQYSDTIPFSEQFFYKYFDKLFSKRFINTILKIKSEDLYTEGTAGSGEFKESKDATYSMSASYDRNECTLTLSLLSRTIYRDANGEIEDGGESAIIYNFNVKNGEFKLIGIGLAG